MPKMTIAWLIAYWGGMLAAFSSPVYGLVLYLFEYYLRPSLHWWGKGIPDWRYSLMASLATLVAFFLMKEDLPVQRFKENPALKWLLAFGVNMLLVTPFAVNLPEHLDTIVVFWKLIVLYAMIIAIIRTEWAFNAFVAMHIAGAGWWGWEAYRDPKRDAGRLLAVGSSDTLNDNQAAGHLLTVLPFVLLFLFLVKDRRYRGLAVVAGPLIVNTFVLCNSRGATVGLVAALGSTLLLAKHGHRLRMVLAGVVVAVLFFMLADDQFIARQQTTLHYSEQSTAQSRISNWNGAFRLLQAHPFGTGGYGYNQLSPIYSPDVVSGRVTGRVSPHNTWILVASEWGIQGLILFLCLVGSTLKMLHRIRSETTDQATYYRSLAIQIALIGTLTAASFSDRLYGESVYWMCALAVVAFRMHRNRDFQASEMVETDPVLHWNPSPATGAAR